VLYRFGDCEIDLDRYELRRAGLHQPVEPQVLDVLVHLIQHRDRLVTKEELLDAVWGDRFVSESALTSRIKSARRAVGDDGHRQGVIRTVHARGYRFVAPTTEEEGDSARSGTAGRRRGGGLVERDSELAVLWTSLDRAESQRSGSVVLVAGEAGIGKSALVRAFQVDTEDEGHAVVLVGGCDDMITPRVLGPIRDMAMVAGGELAAAFDRGADHDDLLGVFLGLLARQPTVVVIEDLHWADDATVDAVRTVARRLRRLPVVLILTYREEDLAADDAFRGVLGVLTGPEVHRLRLAPLSPEGVAALAGETVDPVELHSVTRGNPFFVTEVLSSPGARVPLTVRDAVLARLARLTSPTRSLLQHLAVVPSQAERWLAEALVPDAGPALTEAERNGVLRGSVTHVWIRHELARQVIESSLTSAERMRSNQLVVELLDQRDDVELDRLVHHAAAAGDVERVVRHGPPAAFDAARLGSHRQAVELIRLVLGHADRLTIDETARLAVQLAYSLYVVNQFEESFQAGTRAVALAERASDPLVIADALVTLGRISFWARGPATAQVAVERAVELLGPAGDEPRLATALVELARARSLLARLGVAEPSDEALAIAERAVALALRIGREDLLAQALMYRASARVALDDPGGHDDVDEAVALARRDSRAETAVRACVNASLIDLRSGRLDEAERFVELGLDLAAGSEFFAGEYRLTLTRQLLRAARGEWSEAEADLSELIDRPGEPGIMRSLARSLMARLLARRGALAEADETLAPAIAEAASSDEIHLVGPVVATQLELAWLRGEDRTMRRLAQRGLELAQRYDHRSGRAEMQRWLQRAGEQVDHDGGEPGPWAPSLAGDWRAAAEGWARLGDRYERALELAGSGDAVAADEGLAVLVDLGATATIARLRGA
jgi:DNA-binding winged helix-turn-helix (wHTH) protein/tetratricopeptide (TPR) repeat protein